MMNYVDLRTEWINDVAEDARYDCDGDKLCGTYTKKEKKEMLEMVPLLKAKQATYLENQIVNTMQALKVAEASWKRCASSESIDFDNLYSLNNRIENSKKEIAYLESLRAMFA